MSKKPSLQKEIEPRPKDDRPLADTKPALLGRSTIILIILGIILVTLLYSITFRKMPDGSFSDGTFGKFAYQTLSRLPFINISKATVKSSATLFIDKDVLRVNFNFLPEDTKKVAGLSKSLGVGQEWSSGIAVKLDEGTIFKIKQIVPSLRERGKLKMDIILSNKSIEFANGKFLESAGVLVNSQNMTASESGQVKFEYMEGGMKVEIGSPADVLSQAEESGTVKLSGKIKESLWQLAPKFTRIELQTKGNSFSGKVFFK